MIANSLQNNDLGQHFKTPESRARSLANLKPIRPGESRNPNGRPSAGASIRDWWNQMSGWSRAKLEKVIADRKAPVNKVAAARAWLGACESGGDLDRIFDRTEGRPQQNVDMTSKGESMNVNFTVQIGERIIDADV